MCPICGHQVCLEPSRPPGDAPCPHCGTLLWFDAEPAAPKRTAPLRPARAEAAHPVSPTPGRPLMTAWQYGTLLVKSGQVATGLGILGNVVAHKPEDVTQRRALREIEWKIYAGRKAFQASLAVDVAEFWLEIRAAKHKRAGNFIEWDEIDRAAEKGLAVTPWDADLHVELGHACRARGYREAARFAYQCAAEIAPQRADVRECLAALPE